MSRCFPYPPPGYSLSRASNEALIESIKLRNEREKSNEERKKERRREKKEKRKEREKKEEETNKNSGKSHNVDDVRVEENIWVDSRGKFLQKGRKTEEQLEGSSITEEHEQPLCSRIPSSSSESTENSNKRKRHTSSIDGSNSLGNIIKIRLPSKKKNEPDTSFANPQLCSTSGRMDFPAQWKDEIALRASQGTVCPSLQGIHNLFQGFRTGTDQELISSAFRQIEAAAQGKLGTLSVANTVLTPMQRLELQYKDLVENWVPPELQALVNYPDDQEWLSQSKDNDVRSAKRFRSSGDAISCSSSLALWPQSRRLLDADIYVLPFVVPF